MEVACRNSTGGTNFLAVIVQASLDLIKVGKFECKRTNPHVPNVMLSEIMLRSLQTSYSWHESSTPMIYSFLPDRSHGTFPQMFKSYRGDLPVLYYILERAHQTRGPLD